MYILSNTNTADRQFQILQKVSVVHFASLTFTNCGVMVDESKAKNLSKLTPFLRYFLFFFKKCFSIVFYSIFAANFFQTILLIIKN